MSDAEKVAALMEVIAFMVDQGGTMLVYDMDPAKLPPGLARREDNDWADIPDWAEREPR